MPRPDNYPLPWCEALDTPYWKINLCLIMTRKGWSRWQAGRNMDKIIPRINRALSAIERKKEKSS